VKILRRLGEERQSRGVRKVAARYTNSAARRVKLLAEFPFVI
jgi:hypothetical protein